MPVTWLHPDIKVEDEQLTFYSISSGRQDKGEG